MTRISLSPSQLCELLGIDPSRFICVTNGHWEPDPAGRLKWAHSIDVMIESEERDEHDRHV